MKTEMNRLIGTIFLLILPFISISQTKDTSNQHDTQFHLHFLDEYILPNRLHFEKTRVGGLSGIDYQPEKKEYYVISDDRSKFAPARFYTIHIEIKNNRIDTIAIINKTTLKDVNEQPFASATSKTPTIDPEAIRYKDSTFIWSSEGERLITRKDTILLQPQIYISDRDGKVLDSFKIPEQVKASYEKQGIRRNAGFEGLALSPDGKYLYASIEEPLLQDGPSAGVGDSSGVIRILKFDYRTREIVAQYAYQIDPVVHYPFPKGALRINGVSDILMMDDDHLLVVERSYAFPRLSFNIRVYLADLKEAQDIGQYQSIRHENIHLLPKRLILNMDEVPARIDNIEGVTFGPTLPSGNPSLIFVADNNFKLLQNNQFLLFELVPAP